MKQIMTALFILIVITSCSNDSGDNNIEITLPVSVTDVKPGSIQEFVESTGNLQALKNVQLTSEVEGKYYLQKNPRTKKPYTPGDQVKEGDIIIRLDNPEYENQVAIESQKLNLDISKREYEKQKKLYEKGGITLRELINSEKSNVDAKYAYDNAIIQLAKLYISAPFSGTLVKLPYYTPGVVVAVNQNMAEIMDYGTLYVEVSFPAKEILRIKPGIAVLATDYTMQKDTLNGEISTVSQAIDPETRTFTAGIILKNPQRQFRPGMFIKVEAVVASKSDVIVIPKDIILSKRNGETVFVVQKGAATERVITTGLENDKNVEVLDGLKTGERLVIKGFETLRNRSKVKIVQ